MNTNEDSRHPNPGKDVGLRAWEFNALLLESILLGAVLFAAIFWLMSRIQAVPEAVGFGFATLALGWTIFPALRSYGRSVGRPIGGLRFALGSLAGACVGGLLYWWLR